MKTTIMAVAISASASLFSHQAQAQSGIVLALLRGAAIGAAAGLVDAAIVSSGSATPVIVREPYDTAPRARSMPFQPGLPPGVLYNQPCSACSVPVAERVVYRQTDLYPARYRAVRRAPVVRKY